MLLTLLRLTVVVIQVQNSDIENIGTRDINRGLRNLNLTSLDKEISLGRQLAAEFERQIKPLQDPIIYEYVNRVSQNLALNSDVKVPVAIQVIDSDEINAYALPGGFIYVSRGLISAAGNEAELASAIAHAIARVAARQGTELASKAELFNIASVPLIFLTGPAGLTFLEPENQTLVPVRAAESRQHVTEADFLALQYLYKTGYDPAAAFRFLETLQAKRTVSQALFQTHPPKTERIEAMKGNIDLYLPPRENSIFTTPEFDGIKQRLADIN